MISNCHTCRPTTLVLDYGTTSLKAVLYNSAFEKIKVESREWTYSYPAPEMIEFPAEKYWECTLSAVKSLSSQFSLKDLDTISVTGQSETMIFLDKYGNPFGNAIVWLDSRAEEECAKAAEVFPKEKLYAITGNTDFSSTMPLLKMQWLKRHKPELSEKICKVVLLKDYIIYQLTGVLVSEHTVNCCTGYFDIVRRNWSDELLEMAGLRRNMVPELASSLTVVGTIEQEIAREIGCSSGAKVVNGVLDQCASAIGAGNVKSGMICETTGTVLAIAATLDEFIPEKIEKPVLMFCHGIEGKYLALPNCPTAGVLLTWFRNTFLQETGMSFDDINREIEHRRKNPPELIMLPHFSGRLSPVVAPNATGVLYGLSLKTDRMDIARSIQESVAYMLRENLELLDSLGIKTDRVVSMGGGAKSNVWEQIKADVCRVRMDVLEDEESTGLGCALLAGVAVGKISSDKLSDSAKIRCSVNFDEKQSEIYDVSYKKYQELNRRLGYDGEN